MEQPTFKLDTTRPILALSGQQMSDEGGNKLDVRQVLIVSITQYRNVYQDLKIRAEEIMLTQIVGPKIYCANGFALITREELNYLSRVVTQNGAGFADWTTGQVQRALDEAE